ncbi:copper transporter 6-like [Phoenix dactylifera]|uniref:Copper transport protein n=1 Tax=Phoenix dactylifera TaxID=42345 RepID=A0A8B9A093_PHODC|nr:copper transporter 6-like [Phoenix dactylifera]
MAAMDDGETLPRIALAKSSAMDDGMGDMGHHGMAPMGDMGQGMGDMGHGMDDMHMTFSWGKNAQILFSGWPGDRGGIYALALIVVFVLVVLLEWFNYSRVISPRWSRVVAGLVQTAIRRSPRVPLLRSPGGGGLKEIRGERVGSPVWD